MTKTQNNTAKTEVKIDMTFKSTSEFKSTFGISKIEVVRNPATEKLFAIVHPKDGSETYTLRVQGDYDTAEGESKFMAEKAGDDDSENYCLIKAAPGLEAIETL